MTYQIRKTDGTLVLSLAPGLTDRNKTSIALIGKNVPEFGKDQNENFVKLLENFSNSAEPSNSIKGQLWFNTTQDQIYVKTSAGFKSIGPFGDISTPNLNNIGEVPATTAYVHSVLPKGSIIMWSGIIETIPTGWALCDGNLGASINGQPIPDLRDRFVMGAGNIYDVLVTGGNRTLTDVPLHSHPISGSTTANNIGHTHGGITANAGLHHHAFPGDDQLFNADNQGGWTANPIAPFNYDARSVLGGGGQVWQTSQAGTHSHTFTTAGESTNHTHSFSGNTANAGTSSVDITNPYIAMAFIIKVI
jgi:microcystin-dependent protein